MKTFTSISKYSEGTVGHNENSRMIRVVEEDPKRAGLYIMREYQTHPNGRKTNRFCIGYGKSNQGWILERTKEMIEVI